MPRTQAVNDLRRERLEEAIEILLARYPYLIAPDLPRPKRQVWISDKDRIDLLFSTGDGVLVAEIKCETCNVASVRQLVRYVRILSTEHAVVRGVLIGHRLSPRGKVLLQSCSGDIRFLQLDVDVPFSILVCRECRRAYAKRLDCCPHCGGAEVI